MLHELSFLNKAWLYIPILLLCLVALFSVHIICFSGFRTPTKCLALCVHDAQMERGRRWPLVLRAPRLAGKTVVTWNDCPVWYSTSPAWLQWFYLLAIFLVVFPTFPTKLSAFSCFLFILAHIPSVVKCVNHLGLLFSDFLGDSKSAYFKLCLATNCYTFGGLDFLKPSKWFCFGKKMKSKFPKWPQGPKPSRVHFLSEFIAGYPLFRFSHSDFLSVLETH